jgi:hypothetical protein
MDCTRGDLSPAAHIALLIAHFLLRRSAASKKVNGTRLEDETSVRYVQLDHPNGCPPATASRKSAGARGTERIAVPPPVQILALHRLINGSPSR